MSLRPMFMAFAVGVLACGGESDIEDQAAMPEEESALNGYGYRISGTVSGAIVSGVTVTLSGARTATATTSSSGYYSFSGLGNGTYYVKPSADGFTFNPASRTVTVRGANASGQNFTASVVSATHTISGTVYTATSTGLVPRPGWHVSLRGAVIRGADTDAYGRYAFSGLADGPYTVSVFCPRGEGRGIWVCMPSPVSIVLAGADVGNINFTVRFIPFLTRGVVSDVSPMEEPE